MGNAASQLTPTTSNGALLMSAVIYGGGGLFLFLAMVARAGVERRMSRTSSRPWLRYIQLALVALLLRCLWLIFTGEGVLTGGTGTKCLTGVACAGPIFVTVINRTSMMVYFAAFALAAEQLLRMGRPPPPPDAAPAAGSGMLAAAVAPSSSGAAGGGEGAAADTGPNRPHTSSARRDKWVFRCDLMYLLLAVWLLVVQLVILLVSFLVDLPYDEANHIYDAYIVQVAVLSCIVSITLFLASYWLWRRVGNLILYHRAELHRITGGMAFETPLDDAAEGGAAGDGGSGGGSLEDAALRNVMWLLHKASTGVGDAKAAQREAERRAMELAYTPLRLADGTVVAFEPMARQVLGAAATGGAAAAGGGAAAGGAGAAGLGAGARGSVRAPAASVRRAAAAAPAAGTHSLLLHAPVPADEAAYARYVAAQLESDYALKQQSDRWWFKKELEEAAGSARSPAYRAAASDVLYAMNAGMGRYEDVRAPLLVSDALGAVARQPPSVASRVAIAPAAAAAAAGTTAAGVGSAIAAAVATGGTIAADLSAAEHATAARHKAAASLFWYTRLRIVSAAVLSASLFIVRSVMFVWRPASGTNITGLAGTVMYPWMFYTVPEVLPAVLFAWLAAGFTLSCRWPCSRRRITCCGPCRGWSIGRDGGDDVSAAAAAALRVRLPALAASGAVLRYDDGTQDAAASAAFLAALSQFMTADQEPLLARATAAVSIESAVAHYASLPPEALALATAIHTGELDAPARD